MCMPRELEQIRSKNTPIVMVGGTVEYHGAHCAIGCDTLIAEGLISRLEKTREIIVAPSIWYSPSSYAVAGKESGTVHIEEDAFESYVYYIFKSLLYSGFRNIYVVIHHQFEMENLMPMTLCYMKAAKKAIMRYLEKTRGEGWWGSEEYSNYYASLGELSNPFEWIKVIPTMTAEVQKQTGYDHAGEYETSLLMALYPESVDLTRVDEIKHWYTKEAARANTALGERMAQLSLSYLNERIK